jgi:ribosomal-protein-alanine N-acetyltransferase
VETFRIKLRNYLKTDFSFVHEYAKDPCFSKFQKWGPNTEEETRLFIEVAISHTLRIPRVKFDFGIIDKSQKCLVGGISLHLSKQREEACLGFAVNPRFQNIGYASEAAGLMLEFGFNSLNLNRIFATCDVLNLASKRVLTKIGMKNKKLIKNHVFQKGRYRDTCVFSILK